MSAAYLPSREFHLALADAPLPAVGPAGLVFGEICTTPVIIPDGVSRLAWDAAGLPTLDRPHATLRLEPVVSADGQPRLLLATPPQQPATVNALPAPRLALLSEGDRFHFDEGPLFRLDLFFRPLIGPVPTRLIGVPCGVCSLALAAGDRCLICTCSTPMHAAEDESQPGALACAKMISHCNHCQQLVRLTPAYGDRSGLIEPHHPHE
jgi:hypothetical protein